MTDSPITLRQIQHVGVTVPTEGLDEAKRFYGEILGLQEAYRPEEELGRPGVWYALGETELHIQCRDGGPPVDADYHPGFAVDDVHALKAALQAKGIDIIDSDPVAGRERFFVRDPFGNRLEFLTMPDGSEVQ